MSIFALLFTHINYIHMFILRRITSEGNQSNTCLGAVYNFTARESNPQEFYRAYSAYLGYDPDNITEQFKESVENDVYGFISYNSGKEIMPLLTHNHYYVMTSDGNTFSNITKK